MSFVVNNVQVLFAGLALGSIYALVALGFVLIVRATNVVNFAQGDFAMLGGFAMVAFLSSGLPYWLAFVLALVALGVFGVIFALGVYYPLRHRSFLPVIISTLGASIFMQNTVLYLFGPQPRAMNRLFDKPGIEIGGVYHGHAIPRDSRLHRPSRSPSSTCCSNARCSVKSCKPHRRTRTWRASSAFPSQR